MGVAPNTSKAEEGNLELLTRLYLVLITILNRSFKPYKALIEVVKKVERSVKLS